MNVCVLTHTFPKNSQDVSAAFMKEFSDGLVQAGNKVFVVTPYGVGFNRKGDLFKIYTYKYIWPARFHLLGYSQTMEADVNLRKQAYFLLPFMIFFGTVELFKVVRKEKIDLISVHWILPNGVMAMVVSLFTGVPYAITLPGTDAYLAYRFRLFGLVAKIIAIFSKGVFSNSSLHLKRILDLGVGKKVTGVVGYPVDVSKFKPSAKGVIKLKKKLNVHDNDFVILAIGRLVYKKGFSYLVESLKYVVPKYPKVKLLIGGDGDLMEELTSLVSRLGFSKNVNFLGTVARSEVEEYYNLSNVVVAPSIIDKKGNVDGGPVVSYESMACGKPQIATNILGVADVLVDGKNGFVVPQKNSRAIAKSIIKLISSKRLCKSMGIANRKLVCEELDTKSVGRIYTSYFNDILKISHS